MVRDIAYIYRLRSPEGCNQKLHKSITEDFSFLAVLNIFIKREKK